ncbi:hypothetical protein F66182_9450 [Fusarium sp. NRRL 66182]|nr:hypothetical protein F66182_9450 [Fusarium sp. NRRL 66182]
MSEFSKASRSAARSALASLNLDFPFHAPVSNGEDGEQNSTRKDQDADQSQAARYRFLSAAEWTVFAQGVGGIRDQEQDVPVHPGSGWWPARSLPPGLYRDIVHHRTVSFYFFHLASTIRWVLLILQLILGASLTALGSMSYEDGTPITILGAANTIIAGMLALLHNSGLPDRYRYDKAEFERVEDHVRELLTSGLVRADKTVHETLAECYDLYHHAKATVEANMPATYIPSQVVPAGKRVTHSQSQSHRRGEDMSSKTFPEQAKVKEGSRNQD